MALSISLMLIRPWGIAELYGIGGGVILLIVAHSFAVHLSEPQHGLRARRQIRTIERHDAV